jgi:hypothetical protein
MILVRLKATGIVQEFIPDVARAMIAGGTAELVDRRGKDPAVQIRPAIETAALEHSQQAAIAPAQNPPKRRGGKK